MTDESAGHEMSFSAANGPISSLIPVLAREHRAAAASLLRELGLAPGQELLLMILWRHQPRRQAEITRELAVEPPTAAKMLARLEKSGVVSRVRSPDDGRVMLVSLTQKGRDLQGPVEAMWRNLESRTVADLTAEQQDTLRELIGIVVGRLTNDGEVAHDATTVTSPRVH